MVRFRKHCRRIPALKLSAGLNLTPEKPFRIYNNHEKSSNSENHAEENYKIYFIMEI